jgi:predicted dehydrogenase
VLRVAIVGCGKQADAHAVPISELPFCEIVAACDTEELMAKQLAERFAVRQYFNNVRQMLEVARPDVVHITTPPQSHLDVGTLCLNGGCHVFFEKPFTLNATQAHELIRLATANNRKITVGHNNQFNTVSRRMRALVRDGFLDGPPVHLESIWCYDLGDKSFATALLGDKEHWVRRLPGKLLHNIISHGIGRITEFLDGDDAEVMVHGARSGMLERLNETEIIDELRVIIADHKKTTAYFTFSTQIGPRVQEFRVYGRKNSLIIDDLHQTLIKTSGGAYKYYLNHFIPPALYASQYLRNVRHNIARFLASDFHFEAGRKYLIEAFYRAIVDDTPLPITHREILLTSRIMDAIFAQLPSGVTSHDNRRVGATAREAS